jgi:hypothetical protein
MLAHFAMRLVFGISLMLCLMPRDKVPSAFFRILMLVLLGLSVLASLATGQAPLASLSGSDYWFLSLSNAFAPLLVGLSFVGSIAWAIERRSIGTKILAMTLLVSGLGLWSTTLFLVGSLERSLLIAGGFVRLSQFTSATTLGAAVTGMLLGHRYLTAPGMPLDPLLRMNLYLGLATVLRAIASVWGFKLLPVYLNGETQLTWLLLRWLAGIIGPAIVVVMVHQILKYKNTQSATGVLFVGVILTFIGELTADLLFREVGVPL